MRISVVIALVIVALLILQIPHGAIVNGKENFVKRNIEDTDNDGVDDAYEENTSFVDSLGEEHYILSPYEYDSWYDGLSDGEKVSLGLDKRAEKHTAEEWRELAGDVDYDGFRDDIELAMGLDPLSADSDNDGLTDYEEIMIYHTDPLNNDTDGDGALDGIEVDWLHTDPFNPDTDGDGLPDGLERQYCTIYDDRIDGLNPLLEDSDGDGLNDHIEYNLAKDYAEKNGYNLSYLIPSVMGTDDYDHDGLSDYEEWLVGTDMFSYDTDNDTLNDFEEIVHGTNPLVNDTDGDGLSDYDEIIALGWTDPTNADVDHDGLNDKMEIQYHTNASCYDTDNDGLSDYDEVMVYHTDPLTGDEDRDGLNDSEEVKYGTNASNDDTDGDGLSDKMEVDMGYNPLNPDMDGDGLNDYDEWRYGTNPNNNDTDGDGLKDWQEYENKTDPHNPDTDGDGIPDGQDSDPGTTDYWDTAHYYPEVFITYVRDAYVNSKRNYDGYPPGSKINVRLEAWGNTGNIRIEVHGPGEANITAVNHTDSNYLSADFTVTVLSFSGNISTLFIEATPENGTSVSGDIPVANPKAGMNVTPTIFPLKFPTTVYFNFTSPVADFHLSAPGGVSSRVESIENNSVRVNMTFSSRGEAKVKVYAQLVNASDVVKNVLFHAGVDDFALWEEKLNRLLGRINRYVNITVDISDIRARYYGGDKSALEDLKSIIRVEALTLTAATMISQLADDLAGAAVDIISFKVLLNIILEKIKESETYKEIVEYIINKINGLVAKIMPRLQVDEGVVDELTDEIADKAGEALDSTISEYKEKLKDKIVVWIYSPLVDAHNAMVHQYISENESRERRMKIYTMAQDGAGILSVISGVEEISSSIEEASSLVGDFLNGMPSYKAAMELVEKVSGILATAASALEKYETYTLIDKIIAAYKGEYSYYPSSKESDNVDYVLVFDTGNNGDVFTNLWDILDENYTSGAVVTEQIKMASYVLQFLHGNATLSMLNATADRYMVGVKKYQEWEMNYLNRTYRFVHLDVPSTVIAGREFNITLRTDFNTTISIGNESVDGNNAKFKMSLSEGEHDIRIKVGEKVIELNITAVNLSGMNWKIVGSVLYAVTPGGIIAINAEDYNETPQGILGENAGGNSNNGDNSGNGGGNNGENEHRTNEIGGITGTMMIIAVTVVIAVAVVIGVVAMRRKAENREEKK